MTTFIVIVMFACVVVISVIVQSSRIRDLTDDRDYILASYYDLHYRYMELCDEKINQIMEREK